MSKTKSIVIGTLIVGIAMAACNSGGKRRNPGRIYAPDMTYSRAYDAYTAGDSAIFKGGQVSQLPVQGTIARGHELPDHLKEGDTTAYKTYTTNLRFTEEELDNGRRLFDIYCGVCHGTKLDGNGPLYNGGNGKFAAAPANFKDAKYLNMSVGQMYAAVKFGKNMMGSYASQLDVRERWLVIAYIKKVQSENGGAPFTFGASNTDTTKATATIAMTTDTSKTK